MPAGGACSSAAGDGARSNFLKSAVPLARFGPTASARICGLLRRPCSDSHSCVLIVPTTTTGSPLLMLCDTWPPSSPQHSTSTKKVLPSMKPWVALSKRRSLAATRKLVTAPLCRRTRLGELTTLPMTVILVALTVLLGVCGAQGARPARCRRTEDPRRPGRTAGAAAEICGRGRGLWTAAGGPSPRPGQLPPCEDPERPRTAH